MNDFLNRASERSGFAREVYVEKNLPSDHSAITVLPFFGDQRAEFIVSSLLLRRHKEKFLRGRYLIVCTHPGRAALYPSADEVWGLKGMSDRMASHATGFKSDEARTLHVIQSLNRFFANMQEADVFLKYHNRGLTKFYFDTFSSVEMDLPVVTSPKVEFNKSLMTKGGMKVFVHPSKRIPVLDDKGQEQTRETKFNFWVDLCDKLLSEGITPVLHLCHTSHDLSTKFMDRVVYCTETGVDGVTACMRATGCVLDVFSNQMFYSTFARCPYLTVEDRRRYNELRIYELQDLCPLVPCRMIYSFPDLICSGDYRELINNVVYKALEFVPAIDRERLPTTARQTIESSYDAVRRRKAKMLGFKLFNKS